MKILKSKLFSIVASVSLISGLFLLNISYSQAVGNAYFPQDTTVALTGGNLTILGGSDADQVTVSGNTITVLISATQRFTLTSSSKYSLTNDGNYSFSCDATQSRLDISISSGASQTTVNVNPAFSSCSSGSSGGTTGSSGGYSGGSTSPASSTPTLTPKPTSSPTITPSVSATPVPSPSSTPVTTSPLLGANLAKLYRKSGDSKVYVVQANGLLKLIKSLEDFNSAGYKWTNVKVLPAKSFSKLKIDVSLNAPVLATPAPVSTPVPISNHVRIKSGVKWVNIRNSNSAKGKIVGRALTGQEFEFTDFKGGWYKIKKDGKDLGWILGDYASKI